MEREAKILLLTEMSYLPPSLPCCEPQGANTHFHTVQGLQEPCSDFLHKTPWESPQIHNQSMKKGVAKSKPQEYPGWGEDVVCRGGLWGSALPWLHVVTEQMSGGI